MIEKLLEDIKALQEALQILSKIRNYMASHEHGFMTSDRTIMLIKTLIREFDNEKTTTK